MRKKEAGNSQQKRLILSCIVGISVGILIVCAVMSLTINWDKIPNKVKMFNSSLQRDESQTMEINSEDGYPNQEQIDSIELSFAAEYFMEYFTDEQKLVCKQIIWGLENYKSEISIKHKTVLVEDISDLLNVCIMTTPEIDYIKPIYTVSSDKDNYVYSIEIKYLRTEEEINNRTKSLEQRAEEILVGIENDWNDYEKLVYIHDEIINFCQYDGEAEECYTAYGCLCEGNAVCEGYAKGLMYLCDKAGIGCIPVIGESVEGEAVETHMWNKVLIDNKWYNMDLTWDDPVSDIGKNYLEYDYFAVTDQEISADHVVSPNKFLNYPKAYENVNNYFVKNGLYISDISQAEQKIYDAVGNAMSKNMDSVRFKCSDEDLMDRVIEDIFQNKGNENAKVYSILDEWQNVYSESGYTSNEYIITKNVNMHTIMIQFGRK